MFKEAHRLGVAGATSVRETDVERLGEVAKGWVTCLHTPCRNQGWTLEVTGSQGKDFKQKRDVVRLVF